MLKKKGGNTRNDNEGGLTSFIWGVLGKVVKLWIAASFRSGSIPRKDGRRTGKELTLKGAGNLFTS
jgi:hypothetical protein